MGERSDVLVIGGGLAGLAAACRLAEAGAKVLVLEQRPYLGGRASSFPFRGREVDVGEHLFMRCYSSYIDFLNRVGAREGTHYRLQKQLDVPVYREDRAGRLRGVPLPAPLHVLPALVGFNHLPLGDRLRVMRDGFRLLKSDRDGGALEEETFYRWLCRRSQSDVTIENFWNLILTPALNADVREAAARWGMMVFQEAFLKPHGADLGYSVRGLSRLLDGAPGYLERRGGKIVLGRRVKGVTVENGRVSRVRTAGSEAHAYRADRYVSAVPPGRLLQILPERWAEHPFFAGTSRLRWAPIVNVNLWYDRPIVEMPFIAYAESPLQFLFNRTRLSGDPEPGQHLCISLSAAWSYCRQSSEQLAQLFTEELGRLLPSAREARLQEHLVIKSREATFVPEPGAEARRPGPRTPIENLHLAGDWTRTGWPATMEGAVRSGENCARAMLEGSR